MTSPREERRWLRLGSGRGSWADRNGPLALRPHLAAGVPLLAVALNDNKGLVVNRNGLDRTFGPSLASSGRPSHAIVPQQRSSTPPGGGVLLPRKRALLDEVHHLEDGHVERDDHRTDDRP